MKKKMCRHDQSMEMMFLRKEALILNYSNIWLGNS